MTALAILADVWGRITLTRTSDHTVLHEANGRVSVRHRDPSVAVPATGACAPFSAEIAAATNYRNACAADRAEDIRAAVRQLRGVNGPSLLHVKIQPGSPREIGRPTVKPHEVKERFMEFLRANNPAPVAGP